jgi:multicomponent Na+:H+ antiporter subunit E
VGRGLTAFVIGVTLAALWFALSGRTEPQLLVLGVVSIGLVLFLLHRMSIIDHETAGLRRGVQLLLYWAWLGGEIFKANITVARAVLRIDLDLSPVMVRTPAPQRTDFGRAVYANSITLTPGTIAVDVDEDGFLIHALLEPMADPKGFEAMSRRATAAAEGRP